MDKPSNETLFSKVSPRAYYPDYTVFGLMMALGHTTNEKSPMSENVAMVTEKYRNADFWALFGPEGIVFCHQMSQKVKCKGPTIFWVNPDLAHFIPFP